MGIKAVAITGANKTADYRLWQKVDKGEFSIVFACPEALLGPRLYFFTSTARKPNAFMRNLVAVVVDECHLIHQWRDFRKLYMALGRLRKCCKGVPWLCLSATLTAGAESYVHEVCGFQEQTLRFSISIRRDNVNLIVSTITRPEFEHLHDLIPTRLARSFAIPKTLVFVDSVDNAILIARDLRDRLQAIIDRNRDLIGNRRINPDTVVQTYFSPNDDSAKSATLRTIRDGATRICICTDAFGLGVNIPDVTRVIQWGVSPLLSTSSLFQRVGRAACDPQYRGIAVIYVDETIMKGLPLPSECDDISQLFPNNTSAAAEDEEIRDDELRVALPQLKAGQMERLLLAVEETNTSQVRTLLLELYDVTNDIIQANRAAQAAEQRAQHGSSIKNVDPGVLWVIATKGCRWRVLLSIFGDTNVFASEHSSWCCDNCAHRNVLNPAHELHDIALKQSTAYMRDCPTVAVNKSKRSKTSEPAVKNRDVALCSQRAEDLRKALTKWRRVVFAHMGLPQSVLPCIVLSDNIMEHLVKNAARIVTVSRLRKELERAQVSPLRKKTFKIGCSMLTDAYIDSLFLCIDKTLAYTPDPTELVNRDPAGNTNATGLIFRQHIQASNALACTPKHHLGEARSFGSSSEHRKPGSRESSSSNQPAAPAETYHPAKYGGETRH
jgi:superfamily II DNA helicase RecQ